LPTVKIKTTIVINTILNVFPRFIVYIVLNDLSINGF
jgi:hypothetical protein